MGKPQTSNGAHSKTNNKILPERGVKGRHSGHRAIIKNAGINFQINFQDGETQHVSKSNHPNPPNLRKIMKEAIEKSDEKSL